MKEARRCPRCKSILDENARYCSVCNRYCGIAAREKRGLDRKTAQYKVVCRCCGEVTFFLENQYPTICKSCWNFFNRLEDQPILLDGTIEKKVQNASEKGSIETRSPQVLASRKVWKKSDSEVVVSSNTQLAFICTKSGYTRRLEFPDINVSYVIGTRGNIHLEFFSQPDFSGIEEEHLQLTYYTTGWYAYVKGKQIIYEYSDLYDEPDVKLQGCTFKLENNALITIGDNCTLRVETHE